MKKLLLLLFPLLFISCASKGKTETHSSSKENYQQFWKLWNDDKEDQAVAFLEKWQLEDETDAELYVCYFNMYIDKGTHEQMYIESQLPAGYSGEYMTGRNDDGDTFYMFSLIEYDDEYSARAFEYLDKGLSYNPKRLDMYFGKAQFYFMRKEYDKQMQVIKTAVDLNKKYKDSWLWSFNETTESNRIGFAESLHEYFVKYYNTGDPAAYPYMKELSLLYIQEYPEDVIAYNDAGLSYLLLDDLESARDCFLKGYKLDPSDMILLSNIARIEYNLGYLDSAKSYYEKMAASKDPDYSGYAKEILSTYF